MPYKIFNGKFEPVTYTSDDVLLKIEEDGIKYVDLQFTGLFGRFHHTTMAANMLRKEDFKDGLPKLDGSSIKGFTEIHALVFYASLQNADLSSADLSYAVINNTNLSHANLHNADLRGVNLQEANLTEAVLTGARLNNAQLTAANLNGANLVGAQCRGAILRALE